MRNKDELNLKPEKKAIIISVAQKLFGVYGLEKVSMREIANELGLSKASLYYYFPDKESLYIAVVEKEQAEYLSGLENLVLDNNNPSGFFTEYAGRRLSFFRNLLNLSRLRADYYNSLKPAFRNAFSSFREKERDLITGILEQGKKDGIFIDIDSALVASIYLDVLRGLRIATINSKSNMLYIPDNEYDELLRKTTEFTRIFSRGIRKETA